MGIGGTVWGLIRLLRPLNALLAAAAVLVGAMLAVDSDPAIPCLDGICPDVPAPGPAFPAVPAAMLAAFAITGFGNVLNDLRDTEVDRMAHPRRPLPSGAVSRRAAYRLLGALLSLGLAAAAFAGLWPLLFATATVGLLFLYEFRLKRVGMAGNSAVALLTAATFLFGAVAQGQLHAARFAAIAAVMAFFVNLGREVAKDIEDVKADRGRRWTLPMRIGRGAAGTLAAFAALAGIAMSVPFFTGHLPCVQGQNLVVLAVLLGTADATVAVGGFLAVRRPRWAQQLLKAGMAVALVAFWSVTPSGSCA